MGSRNHGFPDIGTSNAAAGAEFGCPLSVERIEESINDFYANIQGKLQRLEDSYLDSVHLIDQQRVYAIQDQARALEILKNSFDNFCQEIINEYRFTREEGHHLFVDKVTSSVEELSIILDPLLATKAKATSSSTTQKFVGGPETPDV